MGDNVILISSDTDSYHSNSPQSQHSYFDDYDKNTEFLRLGLDQGESSRTRIRNSPSINRKVHDLSGSDYDEEDDCKLPPQPTTYACSDEDMDHNPSYEPWQDGLSPQGSNSSETNVQVSISLRKNLHSVPDLGEINSQPLPSPNNDIDMDLGCRLQYYNEKTNLPMHTGKKATIEQKRYAAKIAKETKQAERAKRLAEQAQVKASKLAVAKARQRLKPEESIKHLSAILDSNLFEQDFCGNLYNELEAAGVTYTVQSQVVPLSVSWIRQVPSGMFDGAETTQHEQHSLLILPCNQLVQLTEKKGLCEYVQGVQAIAPKNKFTLIVHGTKNFFSAQKKTKGNNCKLSQDDFTEALVEVQLFANCDHRFVETCSELATTISQFSKAIAEIPFRLEKEKKEIDKLEWYGESDSRDCVRVDKNGNGLVRLWQQQLCEFNLAGLQMAEAITAMYPSPQALFQAYDSCSSQNKRETMLQDVPIRRGVGALSSVRRIGPELSKKLHTFFTTMDGEVDLSND